MNNEKPACPMSPTGVCNMDDLMNALIEAVHQNPVCNGSAVSALLTVAAMVAREREMPVEQIADCARTVIGAAMNRPVAGFSILFGDGDGSDEPDIDIEFAN